MTKGRASVWPSLATCPDEERFLILTDLVARDNGEAEPEPRKGESTDETYKWGWYPREQGRGVRRTGGHAHKSMPTLQALSVWGEERRISTLSVLMPSAKGSSALSILPYPVPFAGMLA